MSKLQQDFVWCTEDMNITDNCLYTNNTKQPVGMRKNREEQYLKTVSIPRPRVTFKTKTKTLRIVFQNFQDQDQDNNLQEQYTTLRIVSQTVSRPRPRTFKTKTKTLRIVFQNSQDQDQENNLQEQYTKDSVSNCLKTKTENL